ncbi:MAG: bifunctional YncE family protein/alkaline phosphatase family protein [Bryobacterales bacterium]|nr:bifunctional YncE family protein/alkaline phosphatase family protein [Bryobacterales bacterium]
MRRIALFLFVCLPAAAEHRVPAENRAAIRRPGAESILPGGRMISPRGKQFSTGPAPFGLAVSPGGKMIVSIGGANGKRSLSILKQEKNNRWRTSTIEPEEGGGEPNRTSVFMGVAFADGRTVFTSEGGSGQVRVVDVRSGRTKRAYRLNQGEYTNSYTGDMAYDTSRGVLYVADQANFRLVVVDTRKNRVASSVKLGGMPYAVAVSPDGKRAYVTTAGMSGHPAPDPNAVAFVNVEDAAAPRIETLVRTGTGPEGVLATRDRIFVSNARNDSVTIVDAAARRVVAEVGIRIPGMEGLRGVIPIGMAYHEASGWLLVAEAGINAVGVISTRGNRVLGHIPAAWFPSRVATDSDTVYVANAKGHGTGPNTARREAGARTFEPAIHKGAITMFPLPDDSELDRLTRAVYANNGFLPSAAPPAAPREIRYVVVIIKGNRTYDEVFGDIAGGSNGPAAGIWDLARFGEFGIVYPDRRGLQQRLALRSVNVTPNHHELARRFAFSDNFYAGTEVNADGRYWPVDSFAEDGVWRHLAKYGIPYRNFGGDLDAVPAFPDTNIPDQVRATRFIEEMEKMRGKGEQQFPRFIRIHLPNDRTAKARPEDGYPFAASYVADNDFALGRIVGYLSRTPQWKRMAVFIAGESARGGVDHIDSHRTIFLLVSPYARKNYVSHVNASLASLWKTVFRILRLPPLNLYDAAAADLSDCFTGTADFTPFPPQQENKDLFDPAKARGGRASVLQ